jgi:hypothetical protein
LIFASFSTGSHFAASTRMKASKSFGQQLLQILHWAALGHHDRERRIGDLAGGGEVLKVS